MLCMLALRAPEALKGPKDDLKNIFFIVVWLEIYIKLYFGTLLCSRIFDSHVMQATHARSVACVLRKGRSPLRLGYSM